MKYAIFSQNQDMATEWFDKFDKQAIKEAIVAHLTTNPTDTLEFCKEYSKTDLKRFAGMEIISFYKVNPKNNKVSLIVLKGNKEYFKPLE